VTKAGVLLKMAKLPYRADTSGFKKAPKGKLPYIDDDGGETIADLTFIRWHSAALAMAPNPMFRPLLL
jgi:Glutathione S-transferase N-terminal domain